MAHTISGSLRERAEADTDLIAFAAVPTHAERSRTILHGATQGSLATLAKRPAGYPFGSIVMYALDDVGRPIFALSDLAEHSKNLALDHRASLLVTEPPEGADALASGRVTLIGATSRIGPDEHDAARGRYLAAHPHAYYVDFDDFDVYRLEIEAIRFVGGFGLMSWVNPGRYADAEPDPIRPAAHGIVAHMNGDHADAVKLYAEVLGGIENVADATMIAVDRYGFDIVVQTEDGSKTVRLTFDAPLDDSGQVRHEMITLLGRAREGQPTNGG
ncbi:MAG: DUF2470 domain-containing protein [Actinomycetota bacterium]